MIIKIRDLDCYIHSSLDQRNHRLVSPDRGFDLSKLGSEILQDEMKEYITERGRRLSLSSIRTELGNYNQFCRALNDSFPNLMSLKSISKNDLELGCRKWLMKNGMACTFKKKKMDREKDSYSIAPLLSFVNAVMDFLNPSCEADGFAGDVWIIDDLDIPVRYNPSNRQKSISFKTIDQVEIRKEIKQVIKLHLLEKSFGTVCLEMTAIKRFSQWMLENHPEISTLSKVNRSLIKEYLEHTNLEATGRQDYSKELYHLKSVLTTALRNMNVEDYDKLFYKDDFGKQLEKTYRSYNDEEICRINNAILSDANEQVARALFVDQMLGTRISETLTIKCNDFRKNDRGKYEVVIHQWKTHKTYRKPISPDIVALLNKSIEYTKERYGDRDYIFVNDRNPDEPMQYSKIKYTMKKIILKYDLRDDQGERLTIGTHLMRHTYARKLTEMHVDDSTIAKLLGQSGTGSLKFYRAMSPDALYDETKEILEQENLEIEKITEYWDGKRENK